MGSGLYGTFEASINNQLLEDDWRLQGQESYLNGKTLYWRNYSEKSQLNDHDHCDFCTDEISDLPDTWHAGYSLLDEPHATICQKCYEDFKKFFIGKQCQEIILFM